MMFAAGMGISLMFYGVAEPLYHYISPPPGTVDGRTPAAIQTAMATSIFHWTLHPWAMYAVVGNRHGIRHLPPGPQATDLRRVHFAVRHQFRGLALIVFIAGPTLFILNLIPAAVGDYARDLAEMASRTDAVGDEALRTWMSSWTRI